MIHYDRICDKCPLALQQRQTQSIELAYRHTSSLMLDARAQVTFTFGSLQLRQLSSSASVQIVLNL